ncbi:hypothetical protein [Deefgea sp. CFH1-16]|uniref:hypothetical protein n=1 Tax=Deefgea sp. CFH1-16 TaxID=2675457 RepID=UPI0015F41BB2|nr:hypothetical protein [Deefgea sp. CFH1-16]MBM5575802.1 hypothetical protein [Deefgea sp. CFH1-16]
MSGVHIAIATKDDFKRLWRIYRAAENLGYDFTQWELEEHFENCPLKLRRYLAVILGNLNYSGGFSRVLMGCEALIDHCCDKTQDVYDLSPEIKQGLDDTERLNWMLEHDDAKVEKSNTSVQLSYRWQETTHFHGTLCAGEQQTIEIRRLIEKAREVTKPAPAELAAGCHRAHPHEDMNEECQRKTEEVKARVDAQLVKCRYARFGCEIESDGGEACACLLSSVGWLFSLPPLVAPTSAA